MGRENVSEAESCAITATRSARQNLYSRVRGLGVFLKKKRYMSDALKIKKTPLDGLGSESDEPVSLET